MKLSQAYPNRSIAYLYSQIELQKQLLQSVQALLPKDLAKNVCHCLLTDHKLLIYTDSAIWASQLRFYEFVILEGIRQLSTVTVDKIQVRVMAQAMGESTAAKLQAKLPSPDKIQLIEDLSVNIGDEDLRLALAKLSTTLKSIQSTPV